MPQQGEQAPGRGAPGRFGRLVTALAAGIAGGLIAPLIYPAVARNARPVAKQAFKTAIAAFEHGRVVAAELGEHASDLMAEARAEYDTEHKLGDYKLADHKLADQKPGDEKSAVEAQPTPAKEVVMLRGSGRETVGN
jgi:hypothetical protein